MLALLAISDAVALPVRCRTTEFLDASHESARYLGPDPYRPEAFGYVDSDTYPIRIHYRREEDAERAADVILPIADFSWQVQVEEMGWPPPPGDSGLGGDDRYDIYLTNEETGGGAYTWGTGSDTDSTDDWYSLSSFIAMDDRFITDDYMPDFISHEFNHALQYTIDGNEWTIFPWESTAQAMEDLVYDDTNIYAIDIVDFQEFPFLSLLFDGYMREVMAYDSYSYYEYGGNIWSLFLEQRYGSNDGTTLLAFWDAMAQGSARIEPDFVDAIATIGGTGDFAEPYLEFAEWRMFAGSWDDGAHFEEGALWAEDARVGIADTVAAGTLEGLDVVTADNPYDLGGSYFEVTPSGALGDTVYVSATVEADTRWGIVTAAWPEGGGAAIVQRVYGTDPLQADLPLAGMARAVVAVVNLAPADLDPDTSDTNRRAFTLSFTYTDPTPDTDDTGTTDTDPDDTGTPATDDTAVAEDDTAPIDGPKEEAPTAGCGCGTRTAPEGIAIGAAGILLLARARRLLPGVPRV